MVNYAVIKNSDQNKSEQKNEIIKNIGNNMAATGNITVTVMNQNGDPVKGSNNNYISEANFSGANGTSTAKDIQSIVNLIPSSDNIATVTYNGTATTLANVESKGFVANQTNNIVITVKTAAAVKVNYQIASGTPMAGENSSANTVTANGASIILPEGLLKHFTVNEVTINGKNYPAKVEGNKAVVTANIAPTGDGVYDVLVHFSHKSESKPATKPATKPEQKPESKPATKPVVKPEQKPESKPATKPVVVKPVQKPENKPATKPAVKPEQKPENKPATKPAVKPEQKPENKPATKPAVKPEQKPENKPATKPAVKPEQKPESKPATKPAVKPEQKPESKPAVKPEQKPESKPATKPAVKPEQKPESKPVTKPAVKPEQKPESKPATKPAVKPEQKPESKPATKPATKPEQKPESKPATKPAVKPEQKPESKPATKPVVVKPVLNPGVVTGTSNSGNVKTTPMVSGNTVSGNTTVGTDIGTSNVIPVVSSNNQGTAKVQALPDTGLNNNDNAAAKTVGVAGILGVLGLGFLLRKKK